MDRDLELLLMTKGWRRFDWDKLLQEEGWELRYLLKMDLPLTGKTTRFLNENKAAASDIFLSGTSKNFEMLHASSGSPYCIILEKEEM